MVTTRSQSVSPRKRSAPAHYADMETTSTPVSPRKRAVSARATASPTKSKTPRRKSMAPVTVKDEIVVKTEDGDGGEYMNGHAVEKRPQSPRKVSRSRAASGEIKVKGKASHKVDNSGVFEFGGTPGTLAMMTFFPVLMYYLWICSTFYGGNVMVKKGSETWLAFADRMVAHILKVQ